MHDKRYCVIINTQTFATHWFLIITIDRYLTFDYFYLINNLNLIINNYWTCMSVDSQEFYLYVFRISDKYILYNYVALCFV